MDLIATTSDLAAVCARLAKHAVTVTRHPLVAVEADLADAPPADPPPAAAPPTGTR